MISRTITGIGDHKSHHRQEQAVKARAREKHKAKILIARHRATRARAMHMVETLEANNNDDVNISSIYNTRLLTINNINNKHKQI